jgi:membrane associated rhomboid family serine protease
MKYRSNQGFSLNSLWWIIGINFLLFIVTIINGNVLYYLGLIPVEFTRHPWTIITNMFVHAGIGHILANMITLFFFGRALTTLVGENKFLLVYFVGGVVGNILYLLLAEPLSIAVGASGAVYAVAGAMVMMRPNLRVLLYFIVPMPLWVVVLIFFVVFSFIPGVAWQAHLGGLVVGLVAGYFFRRREGRYYYFR